MSKVLEKILSPYYQYVEGLASYSSCINPVLEAAYERFFVNQSHGIGSFEIENYCKAERKYVIEMKNALDLSRKPTQNSV
jgi:hypothetical protein